MVDTIWEITIVSRKRNEDKIYANHYIPVIIYDEFKEHCDSINMKYGLQVENLIRDFNQIMRSMDGRDVFQKVNAMWDRAWDLEVALEGERGVTHSATNR